MNTSEIVQESSTAFSILLADDDTDDCIFFKEAVAGLQFHAQLSILYDGEQLMQYLNNETNKLPDVVFLDLNMPRKNGFECLLEIKLSQRLQQLPVIIFSTSLEQEAVNVLYESGARYYIRKPPEFSAFKKLIHQTVTALVLSQNTFPQSRETFVLKMEPVDYSLKTIT